MHVWGKVALAAIAAYVVWAGAVWVVWRGSGGCMLVSQAASPSRRLEAEVSTCGNHADALETSVWFGDVRDKARALHAKTPIDQSVFDQGPPALTSKIAQTFQLTWLDDSHLEISLPPGLVWARDEGSYLGASVIYKTRSD